MRQHHQRRLPHHPRPDVFLKVRPHHRSRSHGKFIRLFLDLEALRLSLIHIYWEFSAIPPNELAEFADYFALTYKEEGGLITHSLSTAVVSPDGKIFKWYHGADWQISDLLVDIATAAHPVS